MREQRPFSPQGWWATLGVTHKLIVANVIVFLAWQVAPRWFMAAHFTVSWAGVVGHGYVWTLFTSAFSQLGLWHLLWNMLFLHWFGPDLETIYGGRNFLALYLTAALACSLAHLGYEHAWGSDIPALGASGSVMAVTVMTAMFFPHRRMLFMFFIPLPLWVMAGIMIVGDLSGAASGAYGVAHAGHLGGTAAGIAWKLLDLRPFGRPGRAAGRGFFERLGFRWRTRKLKVLPRSPASPSRRSRRGSTPTRPAGSTPSWRRSTPRAWTL